MFSTDTTQFFRRTNAQMNSRICLSMPSEFETAHEFVDFMGALKLASMRYIGLQGFWKKECNYDTI